MPSWSSGASVLDLIFPHPETVSEIRFRNWYTARLSLLVRFDDSTQSPPKREHLAWAAAAVRYKQLLLSVEYREPRIMVNVLIIWFHYEELKSCQTERCGHDRGHIHRKAL